MAAKKEAPKWERDKDAAYVAEIGNIYLVVSPEHTRTKGFKTRAVPKTRYRASVSIWNGKDCVKRLGRDDFPNTYATPKEAMRVCEEICKEATQCSN